MTDNLVERLLNWERVYDEDYDKPEGSLYLEAADRIEGLKELLWAAENDANEAEAYAGELEAVLESIKAKLATCKKYRDAYAECDRIATQAVRDLDAKLAKAVWALKPFKILAKHHAADAPEWGPFDSVSAQVSIMYLRDAMTTIAELTGGNDE